ncbi:hypothetical protein NMG60_11003584 [Bertholletia excelsa]
MDSWRRKRRDDYREATRTRPHNGKPPLGRWQQTVPSWEKKFCTVVGSVPWRKFVETKKFIHLYDNVLKWNDSAGEEAFHNAKNRFWAELNGLPCDISLPDPDIYIDKIDWNSNIDPELLLDLEREFVVPDDQKKGEQVVILSGPVFSNLFFSSNGWGDAEDDLEKMVSASLTNRENPWEQNCVGTNKDVSVNGWSDSCNNFWDSNRWEDDSHEWEPWDTNNRNREDTGNYMSRNRSLRYHADEHLANGEGTNGRGIKRVNFVYERPLRGKRPAPRQWNMMKSCDPISHQG